MPDHSACPAHPPLLTPQSPGVGFPGHRKPLAILTSLALTSLPLTMSGLPQDANAQTLLTPTSAQAPANTVRHYDIPAGALSTILARFAGASGVLVAGAGELTQGKWSPGVSGSHSVPAALHALLADTGLRAQPDTNGAYVLGMIPDHSGNGITTLRNIEVKASGTRSATEGTDSYVALSSGSGKLDIPLIETPRSVSIVTHEQLKMQAPQSIERALAYTPGVQTDVSGSGDLRMISTTIRGFSDGSAYYKDGLKQPAAGTYGSWNDDIDDLDSIEVLKGPASVLYGQGRPGGIVNVVSKRPFAEHVNSLGVSYGTYDRKQINADLGGALDREGNVLYRLNATGRKSDGRTVGSRDDRLSIAPSLLWNISNQTRLTVLGSYSRERGTPKSWWPSLFIYPEIMDLPLRRTAGDPSFDRFNRDTKSIGYILEHETDNGWQLQQNLRYAEIDIDYRHIYADSLRANQRTISRANLAQDTNGKTLALDNRATRNLSWGNLEHTFAIGIDYLRYKEHDGLGFGWDVPDLDIYVPAYGQSIPTPDLDYSDATLKQTGVYALNQLKWGNWIGNLSLRHDIVRTTQSSTTQPRINNEATTGSVGLLYLFDNGVAPYVSYSTAFDPITGRQYDGSAFKPREAKQYEIGVKYQPAGIDALFTLAAFDLYQTNVTTLDIEHPRYSVQTGEVRSTGLEFEAKFPLSPELDVMAGYTYLDPRTTKSNRPAEVGRQTIQTARQTASLWLDYRPREILGLTIAGGVRYRGKALNNVTADGTENFNPAFTLADLALAYETRQYRIALNINNVFDKKYFTGTFRGMERETMLSLNYYW